MIRPLFLVAALLSSTSLFAAEQYSCRDGNITRIISVEYEFKGWDVPCKVKYDKVSEGPVTYPWAAEASPGYCEDRAAFLKGKLENWGWVCTTEVVTEDTSEKD